MIVSILYYVMNVMPSSIVISKSVSLPFRERYSDNVIVVLFDKYTDTILCNSIRWNYVNDTQGYYSYTGKWRIVTDSVEWLNISALFIPSYFSKCSEENNIYCYSSPHCSGTKFELKVEQYLDVYQKLLNLFGVKDKELQVKTDNLISSIMKIDPRKYTGIICQDTYSPNFDIYVH